MPNSTDDSTKLLTDPVLKGRVDGLERDVKSLADTVGKVSINMEHGFENTRKLINQSHAQIGNEVKELYKLVEKAKTPNWQAYGIILGIAFYGITWFVDSKIDPTKEMLKTSAQSSLVSDARSQFERDQNADAIAKLNRDVSDEKILMHERMARLEQINEDRKLWLDQPRSHKK